MQQSRALNRMAENMGETEMKIALVIGHRENAQGAVGSSNISEFNFWNKFVDEMLESGDLSDCNEYRVFKRRDDLKNYTARMIDLHERIDEWGATNSISFHFNDFHNKSVNGHEVLYCSPSGRRLARKLNDKFKQFLDNPNRGIKQRTRRQNGGGFLCRGKSIAILSEPFFAVEQHLYVEDERANLMSAFVEFFNEL